MSDDKDPYKTMWLSDYICDNCHKTFCGTWELSESKPDTLQCPHCHQQSGKPDPAGGVDRKTYTYKNPGKVSW